MRRVGFLLNHDFPHQAAHCIPAAFELARRQGDITVVIITTTEAEFGAVQGIATRYPDASCEFEKVSPPYFALLFDRLTGHALLAKRLAVLWRHRKLFKSLDALVVPDKTSLMLKSWLGSECPLMINTFHGAGDKAGGTHGVAGFDFHLLPGRKYRERLLAEGQAEQDRLAVVGYSKLDCYRNAPRPRLFDNNRPTVLYTPHFDPRFSSWYGWGTQILEYFLNSSEFNLIFAPHVLLYQRRWHISTEGGLPRRTPGIPEHVRNVPHILLDPGSTASIDMTYTRAADIYLGDVSSQVYEFLYLPRPCIFLNRAKDHWQDNDTFRLWRFGQVVESLDELPEALASARRDPDRYRDEQVRGFQEAFDLTDTPSAVRAADAIARFLASTRGK